LLSPALVEVGDACATAKPRVDECIGAEW